MDYLKNSLNQLYSLCKNLSHDDERAMAKNALDSLAEWVGRFWVIDKDLNKAAGRFFMEKDLKLGCKYVSPSLEDVLGYAPEAWVRNPRSWLNAIHPDDRQWVLDHCVQGVLRNPPFACEFRMLSADGRVVWIRDVAIANQDQNGQIVGFFASFLDITESKLLEEKLKASENRYRVYARLMRHATWEWEFASNRLQWSEGLMTHFLHSRQELNSDIFSWYDKIHPDDRDKIAAKLNAIIDDEGNEWMDEYRFKGGDGSYYDVEDRGWIIRDENGKPIRMIGGVTDITERKRMERERDEYLNAERSSRIELQHTVQTLNGLLDTIAHDLKNPLSNILLNVSLIVRFKEKSELPERIVQSLSRIKVSSEKMKNQIDDMLQIARARLNRLKLDRHDYELQEIFGNIREQAKPVLQEAKGKMEVQSTRSDVLLNVDQSLFVKAILALIRFLVANGPKDSTIHLQESYVNGEEFIQLRNLGWKMSEEKLKDLITRGSKDLNFSFAKSIVLAHGGRVWAQSDGEGTVLAISVPSTNLNRRQILVAS